MSFAVEDLAVVDIRLDRAAVLLLRPFAAAFVDVGRGHQFDSRYLERGIRVDEADDTRADRGDAEPVVRPGSLGRLLLGTRELEDLVVDPGRKQRRSGGGRRHVSAGKNVASRWMGLVMVSNLSSKAN